MELLDLPTEILEQILSYNLCWKKNWCPDPYRSKFLARRTVCKIFDILVSRSTIPLLDLSHLRNVYYWTWSVDSITWILSTEVAIYRGDKSPLVTMIRRAAETLSQAIEEWENDTSQEQTERRSKRPYFLLDLWKEISGVMVMKHGNAVVLSKLLKQRGLTDRWGQVDDTMEDVRPVDDTDILSILAWYGNASILRWFMDGRHLDPNTKNNMFGTPLYMAAAAGHPEIVSLLLERNAAVHEERGYWRTPLLVCIRHNSSPSVIDLLIRAGADIDTKHPRIDAPALTAAVGEEAERMVKALDSTSFFDSSLDDYFGRKIINYAGDKGLVALVRKVLGDKVVDEACEEGSTVPSQFSIRCAHDDVIQIILREDLDIRASGGPSDESSDYY